MEDLRNQRAIVTGGNGGLGLGVVEALVARGVKSWSWRATRSAWPRWSVDWA